MELFVLEEPLQDRRLTYCFDSILNIDNTLAGYKVAKWNRYNSSFGQAFRSAEAWLNASEALLMKYKEGDQNSGQEGLDLLNEIREKRIYSGEGNVLEELPMQDADALLELCREERRRELCFEGQRWFDLRRYRVCPVYPERISLTHDYTYYVDELSSEIVRRERFVLKEDDPSWTLPIPYEVLEFNTGMQGNGNPFREGTIIDNPTN